MFGTYDKILDRVKPGTKLRTPDERVGKPFTVEKLTLESVEVKTAKGGKVRIGLFTFETAVKFLEDNLITGEKWLPVKDEDFQMLLNMENDRVRASSYVLGILGAADVIEIDGGRPNRVRLTGR
jgi:hypothetical protein